MTGDLAVSMRMARKLTQDHLARQAAYVLASAATADTDGYPLPPAPDASASGPAGGGVVPATSAAPKADGYGGALGYCAWDNGTITNHAGLIAGEAKIAAVTVAVVTPGADGIFQTGCAQVYSGSGAQGDDYVVTYTAGQILAGVQGNTSFSDSVATAADLSLLAASALKNGQVRLVRDDNALYRYDGSAWLKLSGSGVKTTGDTMTGALQINAPGNSVVTSGWSKWIFESTGVTAKARLGTNDLALSVTTNASFDSSAWVEDTSAQKKFAYLQHLSNGRHEFRTAVAGSGVNWTLSLAFNEASATFGVPLVGIDTTSSAWSKGTGTGLATLDIDDHGALISAAGLTGVGTEVVRNAYFNGTGWVAKQTGLASRFAQIDGAHYWYSAPTASAGSPLAFTNTMSLDAAGNLSLGTTSAGARLALQSSNARVLELAGPNATGSSYINFYTAGRAVDLGFVGFGSSGTNNLHVYTTAAGGGDLALGTIGVEAMRINAARNVLVGRTTDSGLGQFQVNQGVDLAASSGNAYLTRGGGNVLIGGTADTGQRLQVLNSLAITAASGTQWLLMGNQDSAGAATPGIIRAANGTLAFGNGTSWSGTGGTMNVAMTIPTSGAIVLSRPAQTRSLLLERAANTASGLSWYSGNYTAWATYMAQQGQTGVGPIGNFTAPTGTLVTSWALREFVENAAGYGWTWESGTATGNPSIVAELRASDGRMRLAGGLASASTIDVSGDNYLRLGPNSNWGAYLRVGGNGRVSTTDATVATTNGNLHLDSANGANIYLNYYAGGIVYGPGGTTMLSTGNVGSTAGLFIDRGGVAVASQNTATSNGVYRQDETGQSSSLLVFNAGGSTGPVQQRFTYPGAMQFRNQTDSTTWQAWKTVVTDTNVAGYVAGLPAGGLVASATVADPINNGWYRSVGNVGWYSNTYGVGIWAPQSAGGTYGSVSTYGSPSGWAGYSINGRLVFMHDNSDTWGIYDDTRKTWLMLGSMSSKALTTYGSFTSTSYTFAPYFNQSSPNSEGGTIAQVMITNGSDNYMRKASVSQFAAALDGYVLRNGSNNGDYDLASSTNNSAYWAAALELRELNHGGVQSGVQSEAPRLSFHWGSRVASQISMGTDGAILIRNNPGTGYETLRAGTIYSNDNPVWHSGNFNPQQMTGTVMLPSGSGYIGGNSIFVDTLDSYSDTDPLELVYAKGSEVRIGPNGGTKPLTAGSLTSKGLIRAGSNVYTDANYGYGLVGVYDSTRYQGVFAMSDNYKLSADGTSAGNLYGIAWTHTNVGGQSKPGLSHQALFMHAGVTQTAIGTGIWTNGDITATGPLRSGSNVYTANNHGYGLVGVYSDTRYQGVFAMGDSYKLPADGTSTGNLYGIAWTHSNVGGQSKQGLQHQALFMLNGTTQTAIGTGIWTLGTITANGGINAGGSMSAVGSMSLNAGEGNSYNFWGGGSPYRISMGYTPALYQYGPVTDYSIKTSMDSGSPSRGFTWGMDGVKPTAALSQSGNFQIAGYMRADTVFTAGQLSVGSGNFLVDGSGVVVNIHGRTAPNGVIRLTPNLHLNTPAGNAVILNWDNGATDGNLQLRVGNGRSADAFQVYGNGYTWAASDIQAAGALYGNRVFAGYDSGVSGSVSASNWFRSNGDSGWYNSTYGGGIWMRNGSEVEVYNGKALRVNNYIYGTYLNQSSGNDEGGTISQVMITNGGDNFLRKASVAQLAGALSPFTSNATTLQGYSPSISTVSNTVVVRDPGALINANGLYIQYTNGNTGSLLLGSVTINRYGFHKNGFSEPIKFNLGGQSRMDINSIGVTVYGTFTNASDAQLKTNILPLDMGNMLKRVGELKPVSYVFRGQTGTALGFLAQDVQTVFPTLVHSGEDGYLSVAYIELIPVLTAAMQEQQALIADLQKHKLDNVVGKWIASSDQKGRILFESNGKTVLRGYGDIALELHNGDDSPVATFGRSGDLTLAGAIRFGSTRGGFAFNPTGTLVTSDQPGEIVLTSTTAARAALRFQQAAGADAASARVFGYVFGDASGISLADGAGKTLLSARSTNAGSMVAVHGSLSVSNGATSEIVLSSGAAIRSTADGILQVETRSLHVINATTKEAMVTLDALDGSVKAKRFVPTLVADPYAGCAGLDGSIARDARGQVVVCTQ